MKNVIGPLVVLLIGCNFAGDTQAHQRSEKGDASPITSIYTDIAERGCKTVSVDRESGSSLQNCLGVGGYRLLVEDSDNRMSVTVIDPRGRRHPLNYWSVITPNFSTLGRRAEWRVVKTKRGKLPIALIIRVNGNQSTETGKIISFLAVAKITTEMICVTDKITPTPTANAEARVAADSSRLRPCLAP